ncbi:ABC transporter permease [Roseivirga sp. E12]|uniref:ABC transporter permease n=1 Tax=Roseivirga sp. E12 TaxID=2819237 RepID=UPI001ABCCC9A|nr:ABC transporter permease [Roseivirga sp. E12]MBO3700658.1 ABC transporter permease [Roseivirga sp. E12]
MFKNYIKTAVRNLSRNRVFATINILGLVLGISGAIIIYRITQFEHSFESHHQSADQVYRINLVQNNDGDEQKSASVMHPLGPAIQLDYPDWAVSRIHWYWNGVFKYDNDQGVQKKIKQDDNMAFVESDFFEIFDFEIIAGNPNNLLGEPNTMALSVKGAEKLFGLNGSNYQSIIGKRVVFENQLDLVISAVYSDPPKNTDYGIDYLMFYEGAKIYPYSSGLISWGTRNGATRTFIKIPASQDLTQAEVSLKNSSIKYLKNLGIDAEEAGVYFGLQPLKSIHLDPELGAGGYVDQSTLDSMRIIGFILIIIAAINFINLATAQSVKRAKEVGIRKVLGSRKGQIVSQFLGEVAIITMIAILLSLALSEAALMRLEPILGYSLGLNLFSEPSTIIFLIVLLVTVTFLSGFYPSVVLSNYSPVHAIKNSSLTTKSSGRSFSIRRGLVVFQFLISQTLIIGTLVVLFQMDFMRNQPLGFKSEGVLTFPVPERTEENMDVLKSRLTSIAGVDDISFFIATPGASNTNNIDTIEDPRGGDNDGIRSNRKNVDHNYGDLFNLELAAGNFFGKDAPDDHSVINEKLALTLGFENAQAAIGQRYKTTYDRSFYIAGVVKDFHNNSFHSGIDPVFMMKGASQYFEGGISLTGVGNYQTIVDQVEAVWSEVFSGDVFTYDFIEDRISGQYDSEQKIVSLFQVFAGMAIFICCLGLYGLVSFMANQKVKEIGVRKILGASINSILGIFSREVLKLVGIAFLLACPLAYFIMNGWLDGYVYHIKLGAGVFVLGVMATLIIGSFTIGLKVFRSASSNPINSLRDE